MAFVYVIGECYQCKRLISFNPNLVPSLTIGGTREPFCEPCITAANISPARIAKGLPPLVILPGAYEPCDESDMGY